MAGFWACLACDREWAGDDYRPEMDAEDHCGDNSQMLYFAVDSERTRAILERERARYRVSG
jgi:hypothetical protein